MFQRCVAAAVVARSWLSTRDYNLAGIGPMNYSYNIAERISLDGYWPSRSYAVAPPHTPEKVARRFIEAEKAFTACLWNAAVTTYRSVLDIATKAMPGVVEGATLYQRLEWLECNGHITPAMKEWATHVRLEGNTAVHDEGEFSEEDARPLRLFTETFLRYAYELPGEVRAFRAQTPGDVA